MIVPLPFTLPLAALYFFSFLFYCNFFFPTDYLLILDMTPLTVPLTIIRHGFGYGFVWHIRLEYICCLAEIDIMIWARLVLFCVYWIWRFVFVIYLLLVYWVSGHVGVGGYICSVRDLLDSYYLG